MSTSLVEGGDVPMPNYLVDAAKAKLGPASWRIGVPFPRGGPIVLPAGRFDPGTWAAVQMDGVTTIDRGGKAAGVFTYGLTGCLCSALVLTRNHGVERIVLNHYTMNQQWKTIVTQFRSNLGPIGKDDKIYLVVAEAGSGLGAAVARDNVAEAGLKVDSANTYIYARDDGKHVSFGVSLDSYAGELPAAAVDKLPRMGFANSSSSGSGSGKGASSKR